MGPSKRREGGKDEKVGNRAGFRVRISDTLTLTLTLALTLTLNPVLTLLAKRKAGNTGKGK